MTEDKPERVARRIERPEEVEQIRHAIRSAPAGRSARRVSRDATVTAPTASSAARPSGAPRTARRVVTKQLARGDVIRLSPDDGRAHDYLTFKTPSGIIVLAPTEHGSCKVWLLESGTWTYRWGDGEEHVLEVGEQVKHQQQQDQVDASVVDPRSLPSTSLLRRPRL